MWLAEQWQKTKEYFDLTNKEQGWPPVLIILMIIIGLATGATIAFMW